MLLDVTSELMTEVAGEVIARERAKGGTRCTELTRAHLTRYSAGLAPFYLTYSVAYARISDLIIRFLPHLLSLQYNIYQGANTPLP